MLVIAAQENFEVEHWFELIGPGKTAVNSKGECFTIYIPDQWSRCRHKARQHNGPSSPKLLDGHWPVEIACLGLLLTCIRSPVLDGQCWIVSNGVRQWTSLPVVNVRLALDGQFWSKTFGWSMQNGLWWIYFQADGCHLKTCILDHPSLCTTLW